MAVCVLGTTNHALLNKRAEVGLKEAFAFVSEIQGGSGFTEYQKTQLAALSGVSFDESPTWLRLVYAGRTFFERQEA